MAEGTAVSGDAPKRLYVSRSDASLRRLANERQVEAVLRSRGFTIVVPGALSLVEQIRLFKGAEAVVGPHGAGMTNIGFCRPGTRVLELMPGYIRLFMVRIAQGAGLDYRVACFEADDMQQQDWSVDVGQLLDMVSEMIVPAG
jgi:capsular polysaccharide biosynthesis protein